MDIFSLSSVRSQVIALILTLAVLGIVLTSCKAEVNVVVDEDGTGEIEIIGAVNDAIMSLMRLGGEDPFEDLLDLPEEDASTEGLEGASIEAYSQGGYTGVRIKAAFDPYDPMFAVISQEDSLLGGLTDALGIGEFEFTRTAEDDGWVVALDQTTDSSITDGLDEFMGDAPFDFGELDLPFVFSIQLPGEYIEHNADREVNGVLIWDTNLLEGIDISVVTRDPGLQFEIVPIIITAIFVLIFGGIVIGVVVSRERRRRRAEEDAATEAQSEQQIGVDSSM